MTSMTTTIINLRHVWRLFAAIIMTAAALGSGTLGTVPAAAQTAPKFVPLAEPVEGSFDAALSAKIDLDTLPALPELTGKVADRVLAVWAEGARRNLNARAFSKIGDCMTATSDFLTTISLDDIKSGDYPDLARVVAQYKGAEVWESDPTLDSFTVPWVAAASGYNAASVLDPIWSDPALCTVDESPLTCELRLSKPRIAFVMFGTNDLNALKPAEFDYYLRQTVVAVHNNGTLPLLVTFPNQPGREPISVAFNQIVAQVATDYDLPLINLWRTLQDIPNQGVDPKNTTHMTLPPDGKAVDFTANSLQFGHNLHNLLALQTLDAVMTLVKAD